MGLTFLFGNSGDPIGRFAVIYHRADSLFQLANNTPATDSMALEGFEKVIAGIDGAPQSKGKDTLLFQSWLKKGILLDSRYDYSGAKTAYCRALRYHSLDDSLMFVLHVYTGTSYYNLNDFDSARYFLLNAESRANRFADPADNVRLYNTLGVLYFDNGNYEQGKNYFSRALEIVNGRLPFDTASAVSLQTNIATCYYHLGLFGESLDIYHQILKYHQADDPVWLNMGMAYASLEKYRDALNCFRKVTVKNVPGVLNEMGYALWRLQQPDSAARYLDRLDVLAARERAAGTSPGINELDLGTNDLYRADLLAGGGDYLAALQQLQKAIILFSPRFNDPDIRANPASFTGSFASYRLFDALFKKATFLQSMYRVHPSDEWLEAAFNAYRASLSILRYIEKSYDTDDAKLFLKKRNGAVYQGALETCLELYRRHPDKDYLEKAFQISERNKASVISANLRVRSLNGLRGNAEEEDIKYRIARLDVRLQQPLDKSEMEKITREKAGYEIGLAQLQQKLERDGNYYRLKYEDTIPGIRTLQAHLEPNQALISCSLDAHALHIFALTRTAFGYTRIDSVAELGRDVTDWLQMLKTVENGRKFKGGPLGDRLSELLIRPIRALVPGKDEWLIVPDGYLYFLPFESIPAEPAGDPLVASTTISYQFASRLILPQAARTDQEAPDAGVSAFAPFTGDRFLGAGSFHFPPLPASREEIAGLPGVSYTGSQATKAAFLKTLNRYPIVHLATHAVSSANNAAGSFIAFYPRRDTPMEDFLFLEELYALDMNKTKLVVISACETGQGELVSNEGVISLARAFAYAGCGSTISSLWKADDQATSFIIHRFYVYLRQGYKKSVALRRAKLDYLASGTVNKSPAFWSHLVLIGDTSPLYPGGLSWWWGLLLLPFAGGMWWMVRVRQRKRRAG
ncbi:MAG TPA: CHAT domain-containing tetratricopeptide repeat protein [Puia sp.]|nr:CHAT domain-containing tetratricopeptide repeat protein [Puia sp.]